MKVSMRCFLMLVAGLVMLLPLGCGDDDVVWDIAPVVVYVDVTDASGNNLLDRDVQGNIVGEAMTIEYRGEAYGVQWETLWPGYTRAYFAQFHGMLHHPADRYKPASAENPWILEIGELPGDDDYDVTLPLKYKDREFDIRVVNRFKWVNDLHARTTEVYLDGKRCDSQSVSIVL